MTRVTRSDRRANILRYAPLLLWIGVIFFMSSPEASFSQTSRIIGPLLNFFFPEMPEATKTIVHGYVRKTAHVTEYAVLAFLAVRAFSGSASYFPQKRRYVFTLLLVAIVASLDEFNQSFEASRTSSIWDVALDISGGLIMVAVLWILHSRKTNAQARA
jgi:VanZ family protein